MPIGRKRFTARTVETLKLAAPKLVRHGRRFFMDAEVSGFGVKVTEPAAAATSSSSAFQALSTRRPGSSGRAMR